MIHKPRGVGWCMVMSMASFELPLQIYISPRHQSIG